MVGKQNTAYNQLDADYGTMQDGERAVVLAFQRQSPILMVDLHPKMSDSVEFLGSMKRARGFVIHQLAYSQGRLR